MKGLKKHTMKNIECLQIKNCKLTETDAEKAAQLIYQTDEYIYPCIIESEADAVRVLAGLLREGGDAMFSQENLFAAYFEGKLAGIILWKKGALINWNDAALKVKAKELGIKLSPYFEKVKASYFAAYENRPENEISIINVCVDATLHGKGIGTAMLKSFIAEHQSEDMELYVLADNAAAIRIYEKAGFKAAETIQGFSKDDRDLPCLVMKREKSV